MIKKVELLMMNYLSLCNEGKIKKSYSGAGIDSRTIKKSEIFFAIKGESTDGHNYLKKVFERGVSLAVVNSAWFKKNKNNFTDKAFLVVSDTTISLGELANIHRRNFAIPVLCIGGANGKTTTKDLSAAVLAKKYRVLKTEGNFNNHIGLPLTLLRLKKEHQFCVLEVGCNHFGEVKYLCKIAEPDYGLVTNIGREHLEFFKSVRGVARAEFELYDYLKKKDNSAMFFNLDDEHVKKYSKTIQRKITYSYKLNADVKGKFLGYTKSFEPKIEVNFKNNKLKTKVSTFGKHSIFNGLAAATVGFHFQVGKKNIKSAFENFTSSSSKRMEVNFSGGITIVNDAYNSNPESVKMGLESIKEFKTSGDKFIVLSDMLELGKSSKKEHSEIGKEVVRNNFKNLYTFGKESYSTFLNAKGIENNFYFERKEDLIEMLKLNLKKGDVVYIKGSRGMKMEEVANSLK